MNLSNLLSIHNKPWLIEPNAAMQLLDLYEKVSVGAMEYEPKQQPRTLPMSVSGVAFAPTNTYDLQDFAGFAGATTAVIPVSGAIMKNDYCGSFGSQSISRLFAMAESEPTVRNIVMLVDSPGGTVDGTESLSAQIAASTKRTVCAVDGMCASAAMWIGSSCKEMYATSTTDMVGSIGTMVSMRDNTEDMKSRGVVLREYYATASTDKNKVLDDARKGDGKALIAEVLDPINDVFMSRVQANRGSKLDASTLTGKMYMADKAVSLGLLDGVKSMTQILSDCNSTKNLKYSTMNIETLKAQHPDTYSAIFALGQNAERERVNSFLAFRSADQEAVINKIQSGDPITESFRSEMVVKLTTKANVAAVESDNPVNLAPTTVVETSNKSEEELSQEQVNARLLAVMGLSKKA